VDSLPWSRAVVRRLELLGGGLFCGKDKYNHDIACISFYIALFRGYNAKYRMV
jgi:hypothetical protein